MFRLMTGADWHGEAETGGGRGVTDAPGTLLPSPEEPLQGPGTLLQGPEDPEDPEAARRRREGERADELRELDARLAARGARPTTSQGLRGPVRDFSVFEPGARWRVHDVARLGARGRLAELNLPALREGRGRDPPWRGKTVGGPVGGPVVGPVVGFTPPRRVPTVDGFTPPERVPRRRPPARGLDPYTHVTPPGGPPSRSCAARDVGEQSFRCANPSSTCASNASTHPSGSCQ